MAPKSRKRNTQDAPSASHVPETTEPTYDAIRFRSLAHQEHFFEWVENRIPIVEVPFQFHASEFPNITAEVERRGWQYLCNPIQGRLGITLLREFYANAKKTRRERASNPPIYISHIRGKEIDYSPESLKYFIPRGNDTHFTVVLLIRFGILAEYPSPNVDVDVDVEGPSYEARKSSNDQRLGDVLRDICEDHAQWKLDIKGN
ncbi:hypothetical protein PIB30_037145 [Stylosanthes scabra]|uniref:Putative plant transposon protein domain-containing protein n=1 Tax=Stylosanthes scabra TaxID=79078 RepID=A0ABU6RDS3_9FABA|nr:hypothetical protein [Stylosanthes scabra]